MKMLPYPQVLSEDKTIAYAHAGKSLSRFGDGELRICLGGRAPSQSFHPNLQRELKEILRRSSALACIPNLESDTPEMWFWQKYRANNKITALYDIRRHYGSTWIARPDCAPWIENKHYWESMRDLWRNRRIVLVVGEDKCFRAGEMLADGAVHVAPVLGPRVEAWPEADRIEREVLQAFEAQNCSRVIMALGATATVLAERLARRGVHALDLGHAGMFMRRAKIAEAKAK